ncbi:MAG: hypothetical protein IJO96_00240, partial [Oscillospiraceae bacterium]|nr:hypothetical protein [Oscillospiraceae bacterium]
ILAFLRDKNASEVFFYSLRGFILGLLQLCDTSVFYATIILALPRGVGTFGLAVFNHGILKGLVP